MIGAAATPAGGADVWLVRYDPRVVMVPIGRGENAGRTLPHRNVVRQMLRLGRWDGRAATFQLPPLNPFGWSNAVLVQAGRTHPCRGARLSPRL
ncbi:MAG TPA: DUF1223 domain-containing protein [Caulobacteraceae bacterium]|nr:DUF1223 domain-containing protein [Caulobacteraceae bacterium]